LALGRIAVHELRFVTIVLVILDHGLCFFPKQTWAGTGRMTLTRYAEPLFIFVFAHLTIKLRRPMRPKRWSQTGVLSMFSLVGVQFVGAVRPPRESGRGYLGEHRGGRPPDPVAAQDPPWRVHGRSFYGCRRDSKGINGVENSAGKLGLGGMLGARPGTLWAPISQIDIPLGDPCGATKCARGALTVD
jgi:hypothetical protein